MGKRQIYLESLGCARNAVDSEVMLGRLKNAGWTILNDPADAEAIVVNTCSFIEPAIDESIDTILELAKLKKSGSCRRLIVAGCLPQRFKEEMRDSLPEVDVFIGTGAFDQITAAADGLFDGGRCLLPDPDLISEPDGSILRVQSLSHMAYLKIAEGCSRHCTYCIIPTLRGKQKSRPVDAVVAEARRMVDAGVKELILVAQDTTAYGSDLNSAVEISELLKRLSSLSESIWIRTLYGHPESITDRFIETVADLPNVCAYFDIPIQHVSDRILKRMGRNYTESDLYRLYDKIRTACPGAALRTTLITGFPGEKDDDCKRMLDFMDRVRFDHLGVFIYSDSEDLPSHTLAGSVPKETARQRHDLLMSRQREISIENNRQHLDKQYTVLVDEMTEETTAAARTAFQAPEVDGITYLSVTGSVKPGTFTEAIITDTLEYDLIGEPHG
jgi:ribosomal protein S12 methylthiotransferase